MGAARVHWKRGRWALAILLAVATPVRGKDAPAAPPAAAKPDTAPPARLPAARFALERAVRTPMISPDGEWVAARVRDGGKEYLLAYPFGHPTTGARTIALGDTAVSAIHWAGSRRLLLTVVGKATVDDTVYPTTRLIAADLATKKLTLLDRRSQGLMAGDVLYVDPAGDWAMVSSQNDVFSTPSVKRIDLNTGATTTVQRARPDVWDWYADGRGNVRAGIAYAGERWTLWYRDGPEDSLRAIRGRAARDDHGAVDKIVVTGDPARSVIVTNSRTGRFGAYRYDMTTGNVGEPVFEHPEVDIDRVLTSDDGTVTGVLYADDRARTHWIDPAMKRVQGVIDKVLPDASNTILGYSADLNRLLIWSGTASDPGEYYLYDRKAKTMQGFAEPFDRQDLASYAPVRPIEYASRDGLKIRGYLTLPRGRPAKGLPLVVMPHGGPFVRDHWDFDPYVQFLANRGYAVLQPNFRGSTGYGKAFVERGYGQWGLAMQDDIDDGMDWLARQGTIDPKRTCIMGASYGGYAALWGAIRNPERYRCAISLAGVTDLPDMLSYDRRAFNAPRYFRSWQRRVRGEDKRDLDLVSPVAQAARLKVPVLIAQGEKDTIVPPRQARAMIKAMAAAGRTPQSVFYAQEAHGLDEPANATDFLTRVDRFLAAHNPS